MYRPVARQRLVKHIATGANARTKRTYIVKKRVSKHSSLTIEAVFFVIRAVVTNKSSDDRN
jgi:hypothetical protein